MSTWRYGSTLKSSSHLENPPAAVGTGQHEVGSGTGQPTITILERMDCDKPDMGDGRAEDGLDITIGAADAPLRETEPTGDRGADVSGVELFPSVYGTTA